MTFDYIARRSLATNKSLDTSIFRDYTTHVTTQHPRHLTEEEAILYAARFHKEAVKTIHMQALFLLKECLDTTQPMEVKIEPAKTKLSVRRLRNYVRRTWTINKKYKAKQTQLQKAIAKINLLKVNINVM